MTLTDVLTIVAILLISFGVLTALIALTEKHQHREARFIVLLSQAALIALTLISGFFGIVMIGFWVTTGDISGPVWGALGLLLGIISFSAALAAESPDFRSPFGFAFIVLLEAGVISLSLLGVATFVLALIWVTHHPWLMTVANPNLQGLLRDVQQHHGCGDRATWLLWCAGATAVSIPYLMLLLARITGTEPSPGKTPNHTSDAQRESASLAEIGRLVGSKACWIRCMRTTELANQYYETMTAENPTAAGERTAKLMVLLAVDSKQPLPETYASMLEFLRREIKPYQTEALMTADKE